MQITPLNLSHQHVLKEKFQELHLKFAEYTFANLYLFRTIHRYQVIQEEKELFIKGYTHDQEPFLMLTSHPKHISMDVLKSLMTDVFFLFPIPEEWIPYFDKSFEAPYYQEADSDYLFRITKLAHFPGRHLSNKRNLVKQLFETHDVECHILNANTLKDALFILEAWQRDSEQEQTDYLACKEALERFDELLLFGRIIMVDTQPAAFILGEWTTSDCFVAHFSKANREIKGLYQYLYQDLAQFIEREEGKQGQGKDTWINLEQDLGIEAIHDAKHSYHPDEMLHKWRVLPSKTKRSSLECGARHHP